jgi:hypothetical protein
MDRQPVGVTVVRPRPARTAAATRTGPRGALVRAALLLVALAVAYRYSWLTLIRTPHGSLAGLGIAAMLAITAIAPRRRQRAEPAIYDRYTDVIVGLPLLAGALAIVLLLPSRLSLFFWFWRLDLLSIPLFLAAAVALLFGVRALWHLRLAIGALLLVWLLRHDALLSVPTLLAMVAGLTAVAIGIRGRSMRPTVGRRPSAVGRPVVAAAVLMLAAAAATIANGSLDRFQPLLTDDGRPRLVSTAPASLDGWTLYPSGSYDWIRGYIGGDASWDRYAYQRPQTPSMIVDVISSVRRGPLTDSGLESFYRLHDHQLVSRRDVSLGGGLVGQAVTYLDASHSSWSAVYWDWPIASASGIRYERVVVSRDAAVDAATVSALVRFAETFVAGTGR